jgi:hypothetical protein
MSGAGASDGGSSGILAPSYAEVKGKGLSLAVNPPASQIRHHSLIGRNGDLHRLSHPDLEIIHVRYAKVLITKVMHTSESQGKYAIYGYWSGSPA